MKINWDDYHNYLRKNKITYRQYLKSNHWKDVRKRFYKKHRGKIKCFNCGRSKVILHLHHKTYARLGKEKLTDLVLLCKSCHRQEHNLPKIKLWGWVRRIMRIR